MKASLPVASKGQALAELIIACAILAIILLGIVTTISFSLNTTTVAANKTLSLYYAQQGIERVRGFRNENGWNNIDIAGQPQAVIQNNGVNTIFTRTVTVASDIAFITDSNIRRVTSTVSWIDGGQQYDTRLTTVLTNH